MGNLCDAVDVVAGVLYLSVFEFQPFLESLYMKLCHHGPCQSSCTKVIVIIETLLIKQGVIPESELNQFLDSLIIVIHPGHEFSEGTSFLKELMVK